MKFARREFLQIAGAATASTIASTTLAQTSSGGPRANQILRKDLEAQDQRVQETVVTIVEFPPGAVAPWHMHPGAQEILYGLEGSLTVEIEGGGKTIVKVSETGLIAANVPHTVRNEGTSATAKVVVVHSRSDKDKPLRVDVKKS